MRKISVLLLALSALLMFSCSGDDSDDNIFFGNKTGDETTDYRFKRGVVIKGDVGTLGEVIKTLCVNIKSEVDNNTKLLFTSNLENEKTSVNETLALGGYVAVVEPGLAEMNAFFAGNTNLEKPPFNESIESMEIYCFDRKGNTHGVMKRDSEASFVSESDVKKLLKSETEKENLPEIFSYLKDSRYDFVNDGAKEYSAEEGYHTETSETLGEPSSYAENLEDETSEETFNDTEITEYLSAAISGWLKELDEDLRGDEKSLSRTENSRSGDDEEEKKKVENLFNAAHYSETFPFSAKKKVYKITASKPDYISGSGSITVSYDVYQIHCYEKEHNNDVSGDYYLVGMNGSIANGEMFRGKWWNKHGGCRVRLCGFYGKEFHISSTPVHDANYDKTNNRWTSVAYDGNTVTFPASGVPVPGTTQGSTKYTKQFSFGVSTSLSVSGKASDGTTGGKPDTGKGIEAKADVALDWKWTNTEEREVHDTDVKNETKDGNVSAHALIFNNLPKFKWSEDKGFDLGNALSYRSTMDVAPMWVWYVKDAKDNDTTSYPMAICFRASTVYGSMNFLTTKADLKTHEFRDIGSVEWVFPLPMTERRTFARFRIDVPENYKYSSINNINVYQFQDKKFENPILTRTESYRKGQFVLLDAIRTMDDKGAKVQYTATFDAFDQATKKKISFIYHATEDYFTLDHLRERTDENHRPLTLLSDDDFTEKK